LNLYRGDHWALIEYNTTTEMSDAADQPMMNLSDLLETREDSATYQVEKLKADLIRLRAGSVEFNSCAGQIMFLEALIQGDATIAEAHAAMWDGLKIIPIREGDCLMGWSLSRAFSVQNNMPPRRNLLQVRYDIAETLRRAAVSADERGHFGELATSMMGQGHNGGRRSWRGGSGSG